MTSITKIFFFLNHKYSFLLSEILLNECRSDTCKEYKFWSLGTLPTGWMIASPINIQILKFYLCCQEFINPFSHLFIEFNNYFNNSLNVCCVSSPAFKKEIQHKQGRHGNLVGILREGDYDNWLRRTREAIRRPGKSILFHRHDGSWV